MSKSNRPPLALSRLVSNPTTRLRNNTVSAEQFGQRVLTLIRNEYSKTQR